MNVEHKVDMHRLATARRKQGRPVWAYTVRGFKDALDQYDEDADNFIEVRDAVVQRIKASKWFRDADEFGDLHDTVDELADVGHPEIDWDDDYDRQRHFNECLERIYDLADWDRAWLQ